jgi:hypothetical protein
MTQRRYEAVGPDVQANVMASFGIRSEDIGGGRKGMSYSWKCFLPMVVAGVAFTAQAQTSKTPDITRTSAAQVGAVASCLVSHCF